MEVHFASPLRMDMSLTFQNPFSSPMPLLRTDERWVLAWLRQEAAELFELGRS